MITCMDSLGIVKGCGYKMYYNVIQDNNQLFIVTKLSEITSHTSVLINSSLVKHEILPKNKQLARFFLKGLTKGRS